VRKYLFALAAVGVCLVACAAPQTYSEAVKLADLEASFIDEASGIADSRENPGVLWVHNDSGDGAYLYGVDLQGKTRAVYLVNSAAANDWEDMAFGPGPDGKGNFLYLGDIGDNAKARTDGTVYRIREPKIPANAPKTKEAALTTPEGTIRRGFQYPDGAHNAEALLCHPKTGTLYIVTKEESGASGVYRFPAEPMNWWEKNTLTRVGTFTIPDRDRSPLVTGGDISPDGKRVILQTYTDAYELALPDGASDFEQIWNAVPRRVAFPKLEQGEAVCYSTDGKAIYTTSEKTPAPLYVLRAK
jgi:hypothetical protein